jgi:hypothetical protein
LGFVFKALGDADYELAGAHMGTNAHEGGAKELGGNGGDDDLGGGEGCAGGGDVDGGGEGKAGKELGVFSGIDDLLRELTAMRPEGERVPAAAME